MKIYSTFLLLLIASISYSQDIIFLNNGEVKKTIVKEINQDEIVYKDYANQNGPNYRVLKLDIKKIIFQNGKIEVFDIRASNKNENKLKTNVLNSNEPITVNTKGSPEFKVGGKTATKQEVHNLMKQYPDALRDFKKYTSHRGGRIAFNIIGGAVVLGTLVNSAVVEGENGSIIIFLGTTLGLGTASFFISSGEDKKLKKAISTYNSHVRNLSYRDNKQPIIATFGLTSNGVGVSINF